MVLRCAGEGVLFNPAVAFELLRTAANRGDPEAQTEVGFRLALGIHPPPQGTVLAHPLYTGIPTFNIQFSWDANSPCRPITFQDCTGALVSMMRDT